MTLREIIITKMSGSDSPEDAAIKIVRELNDRLRLVENGQLDDDPKMLEICRF